MRILLAFFAVMWDVFSFELSLIPESGSPSHRRQYPQMVVYQNKLYLFGGIDSNREFQSTMHIFDVAIQLWEKITPSQVNAPLGRSEFAMFKKSEGIMIMGGLSLYGKLGDIWLYNIIQNVWQEINPLGDVPPPFYGPGFTDFEFNGTLYFAIGCFGTGDGAGGNQLYLFDPSDQTWQQLPNVGKVKPDGSVHGLPKENRACNIKFDNGYIYQWGGTQYDIPYGMYRYDLTAQAWEELEHDKNGEPKPQGQPQGYSYFGSIIKDGNWILFPGWDGYKNTDKIWSVELPPPESNIVRWREIPKVKDEAFIEGVVVDVYGFAHIEPYVYFHGGYTTTHPVGNFISRLNMNQVPLKAEIISPTVDVPSGRSYHSLTAIGNKLYMFGGYDGEIALDELWAFDAEIEKWEYKETFGEQPSRRWGHAAGQKGTNLLIWGGKNGFLLYDDMFMYNVLSNTWTELEISSDESPPGAEGAWLVSIKENVYIYGGRGEVSSLNDIWQYHIGTHKYTRATQHVAKILAPEPTSYHKCFVYQDQLIAILGITDDLGNPNDINFWNFETNQWSIVDNTDIDGRSRAVADIIGTDIIYIGGEEWNTHSTGNVNAIHFAERSYENIDAISYKTWAAAGAYHKNSFYIFGGGGSYESDGAIRPKHASDNFYKYTLDESYVCSKGAYRENGECVLCPRGTYKVDTGDNTCTKWPPGTANPQFGADDSKFCILCILGTYNHNEGSPYCYQCPTYMYWEIGATSQKEVTPTVVDFSKSEQPNNYENDTETIKTGMSYLTYAFIFLFVSIFTTIICSKWAKRRLPSIDQFTESHNYDEGQVMTVRSTNIGGFCSLLFFCAAAYIIIQTSLYFTYENVTETKAQIPIVVVNQKWGEIKGQIDIIVVFKQYGGKCVTDQGKCNPHIKYDKFAVTGTFRALKCSRTVDDDWNLHLVCDDCLLQAQSEISFTSEEFLAYAGSIDVQVWTESSIPGEDSYIDYSMEPDEIDEVFKGSEDTIFSFVAIPSIFESELSEDPSISKGYHMALGAKNTKGSQSGVEDLSSVGFLNVEIQFDTAIAALHTKREYKVRWLILVMTLLGSIAGLVGTFGTAMGFVEERWIQYRSQKKKHAISKKVKPKTYLKEYYDEIESKKHQIRKSMQWPARIATGDNILNTKFVIIPSIDYDENTDGEEFTTIRSPSLIRDDTMLEDPIPMPPPVSLTYQSRLR